MRLFLGMPIPPELAQSLTRRTQAIELPKGRRTAPENLHLTLVFLGQVPEPTLPHIERELSELNFAPFPLKLTSVNTFPRGGVLVAEVEPARALLHLQERSPPPWPAAASPPKTVPTTLTSHSPASMGRYDSANQQSLPTSLQRSFTADTVNLYRSNLTPTGSHYEILAQKKATKPIKPVTHP